MKILITGGTGFIGQALCRRLLADNHQLTVLSRNPKKAPQLCGPDIKGIKSLTRLHNQDSFDAIINLAGEPIFDKYWNLHQKKIIIDSRINITKNIIDYIKKTDHKPTILINASAIGFYGDTGNDELDEFPTPSSNEFAHQVCLQWEHTAQQAEQYGVRVCILRIGLVLGKHGGFLKKMLLPFKLGLGGPVGNGTQWMSWIHMNDLVNIIVFLLEHNKLSGVFNGTAPLPVRNKKFVSILGKQLHRPTILPAPGFILKVILGERADLLLGGQYVLPKRVIKAGYIFQFNSAKDALDDILS